MGFWSVSIDASDWRTASLLSMKRRRPQNQGFCRKVARVKAGYHPEQAFAQQRGGRDLGHLLPNRKEIWSFDTASCSHHLKLIPVSKHQGKKTKKCKWCNNNAHDVSRDAAVNVFTKRAVQQHQRWYSAGLP
jgi:hypothetical protein